jgi:hypothetical protein
MATPDVIRKQITPSTNEAQCGNCATEMALTEMESLDDNRILYCPKCHHVDQQSGRAFAAATETIAIDVTIKDVYFNQLDPKDIPPPLASALRVWSLVYDYFPTDEADYEQTAHLLVTLIPDGTITAITDLSGMTCPLDIGNGEICGAMIHADGSCPRHGFDKQHDPTRH